MNKCSGSLTAYPGVLFPSVLKPPVLSGIFQEILLPSELLLTSVHRKIIPLTDAFLLL